ncbi:tetratricopeptide repeat protein [Candidatus Lokiarchaeum ossiferum]|uniref:tetratricopeptide repeat protein n=1 Tax=Candidatus Lokiarchaeum ossiferum TaxID=2951803 RepID=UPI00352E0E95
MIKQTITQDKIFNMKIAQLENYLSKGFYSEGLEYINAIRSEMVCNNLETILLNYFKSVFLFKIGELHESLELIEINIKNISRNNEELIYLDYLIMKAKILFELRELTKSWEAIVYCERIFDEKSSYLTKNLELRRAKILNFKGWYFLQKFGEDSEEKKTSITFFNLASQILDELREKENSIGIKREYRTSLHYKATYYYLRGDLDTSLKYILEKVDKYEPDSRDREGKVLMGSIYLAKGDMSSAIENFKQGLKIAENNKNLVGIIRCNNSIGNAYHQNGEPLKAEKYLINALNDSKKLKVSQEFLFFGVVDSLLILSLEIGHIKQADIYFKELQNIESRNNKLEIFKLIKQIDKALILKTSLRSRSRVEAEDILKSVLEKKKIPWELTERVLLHLCDLLLTELRITQDIEVENELETIVNTLKNAAKNQSSIRLFAETLLLEAKMALIDLNLKKARILLIEAQKYAQTHKIEQIAQKISMEHDELLKEWDLWESFDINQISIDERMRLAKIRDQLNSMMWKSKNKSVNSLNEVPIFLLISQETGLPLMSKSFTNDWNISDGIFGSFLSAFNTFSKNIFDEGLDRAKFGNYMIVIKKIQSIHIFYVYKGHSYSAQKKIDKFAEQIQINDEIWNKFEKAQKYNFFLKLDNEPSLSRLISKIIK